MDTWIIVAYVVYGVGIVVTFVWFMVSFFRRHSDGAAEFDTLDIITYVTLLLAVCIFWLPVLFVMLVMESLRKKRKRNPTPTP